MLMIVLTLSTRRVAMMYWYKRTNTVCASAAEVPRQQLLQQLDHSSSPFEHRFSFFPSSFRLSIEAESWLLLHNGAEVWLCYIDDDLTAVVRVLASITISSKTKEFCVDSVSNERADSTGVLSRILVLLLVNQILAITVKMFVTIQ